MIVTSKVTYLLHAGATSILGVALNVASDGDPSMVAAVLDAMGIGLDPPHFLAGLLFGVSGGFVAMAHSPPDDRIDKIGTLLTAALIATFAAILHPLVAIIAEWPPQIVMGVAGLGSRKIVDAVRAVDIGQLWKRGPK